MIMFAPFSEPLVGFGATKVYSGMGAEIVMESITLTEVLSAVGLSNQELFLVTLSTASACAPSGHTGM
jgi:hypothetical protein